MHGWDLFCQVIDNFGDIGVAWRLARQLVAEHGCSVRLFVDDLNTFAAICPELDPQTPVQCVAGVEVLQWVRQSTVAPAAVVIELFGCHLDPLYRERIGPQQVWFNLEYLSAEDWIEGCHLLPSPQPGGAHKRFFYPGFTPDSGGLLRESDLLARRDAWLADPDRQTELRRQLGLPPRRSGDFEVLLFCYPAPQLPGWLQALADHPLPTRLLVCPGAARPALEAWLGRPLLPGQPVQRGSLQLCGLPLVAQPRFDALLWLADFCIVRGEDSFVRAQWAARPLLWHIYPQHDDAHLIKLDAFLDRYLPGLEPAARDALRALWQGWNRGQDCVQAWDTCRALLPQLQQQARSWCAGLSRQTDLASQLVDAATAAKLQ